jgi:hypothetical protein
MIKLLRAFDPYCRLDPLQKYCLAIALYAECELDEILSLVQVCAVNPKIRLNFKQFHFYVDFQSYHGDSYSQVTINKFERRCRTLLDEAIAKSLLVNTQFRHVHYV